jgi:hypothetical protein
MNYLILVLSLALLNQSFGTKFQKFIEKVLEIDFLPHNFVGEVPRNLKSL